MTFKVFAGIHLEALRLWRNGRRHDAAVIEAATHVLVTVRLSAMKMTP